MNSSPSIWNQLLITKLLFTLFFAITAIYIDIPHLLFYIVIMFLYMVFCPTILKHLFNAIRLLLPFFVMYLVSAVVLGMEFISQLHFLLRVFYLIMLSVYTIKCSRILDVYTIPGIKKKGWGPILSYLLGVYLYIPKITSEFRRLYRKKNIQFYQVIRIAEVLADVFVVCLQELDDINKQADEMLNRKFERQRFGLGDIILIWIGMSKIFILLFKI